MRPVFLASRMGLDPLLEKKAGSVQSLRAAWTKGWDDCLSIGMPPAEIALVAEHLKQPQSLSWLAGCLKRDVAAKPKRGASVSALLMQIDDSSYSLSDWMKAIEILMAHVARQHRPVALSRLIGYVACSAELAASSQPERPLPEVVGDLLDQHGLAQE